MLSGLFLDDAYTRDYVGGLLRGLPYRPNVTTSGRGKCSVLTGKPGRARANMRLLLAARCVHNQLAQLQSARATAKRAATTYVYARHAPAAAELAPCQQLNGHIAVEFVTCRSSTAAF